MTKKFDFKTHDEIPKDLVEYVLSASNEKRIEDLSITEINEFLNEVDLFLSNDSESEWMWVDSGIEIGF
jgi:hypothetical protein